MLKTKNRGESSLQIERRRRPEKALKIDDTRINVSRALWVSDLSIFLKKWHYGTNVGRQNTNVILRYKPPMKLHPFHFVALTLSLLLASCVPIPTTPPTPDLAAEIKTALLRPRNRTRQNR